MTERVSDTALQLMRNEAERSCLLGTAAALDELIERRAAEKITEQPPQYLLVAESTLRSWARCCANNECGTVYRSISEILYQREPGIALNNAPSNEGVPAQADRSSGSHQITEQPPQEPVAYAYSTEYGNRLLSFEKTTADGWLNETPLYAAPQAAGGMVLVPRDPTNEMTCAGTNVPIRINNEQYFTHDDEAAEIYKAMLDASQKATGKPPERS